MIYMIGAAYLYFKKKKLINLFAFDESRLKYVDFFLMKLTGIHVG